MDVCDWSAQEIHLHLDVLPLHLVFRISFSHYQHSQWGQESDSSLKQRAWESTPGSTGCGDKISIDIVGG